MLFAGQLLLAPEPPAADEERPAIHAALHPLAAGPGATTEFVPSPPASAGTLEVEPAKGEADEDEEREPLVDLSGIVAALDDAPTLTAAAAAETLRTHSTLTLDVDAEGEARTEDVSLTVSALAQEADSQSCQPGQGPRDECDWKETEYFERPAIEVGDEARLIGAGGGTQVRYGSQAQIYAYIGGYYDLDSKTDKWFVENSLDDTEDSEWYDSTVGLEDWEWKVSGEGTIDAFGVYTAPDGPDSSGPDGEIPSTSVTVTFTYTLDDDPWPIVDNHGYRYGSLNDDPVDNTLSFTFEVVDGIGEGETTIDGPGGGGGDGPFEPGGPGGPSGPGGPGGPGGGSPPPPPPPGGGGGGGPAYGDQTSLGSSFRVDVHGLPQPDASPTGEGESDRVPNAAHVDPFTLLPTFRSTDATVPVPGGELSLDFRRTLSARSRSTLFTPNNVDGFPGANFRWPIESVMGHAQSTNTAARLIHSNNAGRHPLAFWEPTESVTVYDEGGSASGFVRYEGRSRWYPERRSSFSNSALRGTLTGNNGSFVYTHTHGTKLTFQRADSFKRGDGPKASTETCNRLHEVQDRNGNTLRYEYGLTDARFNGLTIDWSASPNTSALNVSRHARNTLVTRIFDPATEGGSTRRELVFDYTRVGGIQDLRGFPKQSRRHRGPPCERHRPARTHAPLPLLPGLRHRSDVPHSARTSGS